MPGPSAKSNEPAVSDRANCCTLLLAQFCGRVHKNTDVGRACLIPRPRKDTSRVRPRNRIGP
eukprot:3038295-Pyramimonas_sp.AAC.1